jgi:hypothetical protein
MTSHLSVDARHEKHKLLEMGVSIRSIEAGSLTLNSVRADIRAAPFTVCKDQSRSCENSRIKDGSSLWATPTLLMDFGRLRASCSNGACHCVSEIESGSNADHD